jgi:uncharacterized Zn finger protein
MGWYRNRWPEYVPVAKRKAQAAKEIEKLKKKGKEIDPVIIEGQKISKTFWGKAWCENLESYSDFENRLPRGRTYVRNGSVMDLKISQGKINALVNGSSLYTINIAINPIQDIKWETLVKQCSGKIDSLIELLQGKFSKGVMEIITHKEQGLFPHPKEIKLKCSCPDYADMCKHVAAALYGVGARLDTNPEQLFILRHVDHYALLNAAESANKFTSSKKSTTFSDKDLSSLFGIEMDEKPIAEKNPVVQRIKKVKKTIKPKVKQKITLKKKPVKKAVKKAVKKVVKKVSIKKQKVKKL